MRKYSAVCIAASLAIFFPVSPASANSLCAMQYQADTMTCGSNEACQDRAALKYLDCMDRSEETNQ